MFDQTTVPLSVSDSPESASDEMNPQAKAEEILHSTRREAGRGGDDVGFERALADWIIRQRAEWRESRRSEVRLKGSPAP
jgi:hypothetical protein